MSIDTALNEQGWQPNAATRRRYHRRKGLPRALLTILLLLSLTTLVGAQDGANAPLPAGVDSKADKPAEPAAAPAKPEEKKDEPKKDEPAAAGNATSAPEPPKPEPPKEEPKKDEEHPEEGGDDQFLKNGKPRIKIESISPAHGPTTGDTKVTVRGGPFAQF